MSNTAITYLVAACAGVFGLAAFVGLILVPVLGSYQRIWQRAVATFLSLYVLAALVGIGVLAGGAIIYFWPRVF
jgi:hypothetical protein